MPWIQNVALADVPKKHHVAVGENSMLIQIVDPAMFPPVPAKNFHSIFQFEFLDLDDSDIDKHSDDEGFAEFVITEQQAVELVDILKFAQEKELNVLVHCVAGVCRSGAVVEVGVEVVRVGGAGEAAVEVRERGVGERGEFLVSHYDLS